MQVQPPSGINSDLKHRESTRSFRLRNETPRATKSLVISDVDREVAEWFRELATVFGGSGSALRYLWKEDQERHYKPSPWPE